MHRILFSIAFVVIAIFAASISVHRIWSNIISIEVAVSVAAALTSALSVLFLSVQVLHQARLSQGQLIEKLSQDLDKNVRVEIDMDEEGILHEIVNKLTTEQLASILSFLTLCERINVIMELDLVPLEVFNELYGYRFFLIVHNPNTQEHVLLKPNLKESWTAIFRLHKRWIKFRTENRMSIPRDGGLTALESDATYQGS